MLNLTADELVSAYQDACIENHLLRRQVNSLSRENEALHQEVRAAQPHTHHTDDGPVTHKHAESPASAKP